jgi:hypothetical protein
MELSYEIPVVITRVIEGDDTEDESSQTTIDSHFNIKIKLNYNERIGICKRPRCNRLFTAQLKSKFYCSERCRRSEEKARNRRR